ncbi:purine-nucleoside phosphorylase [Peptostreptococcus equinus]|uniref:Purine nucleoside phosphorylase n=1 Tax=Peptostreptococcus equinus TaxID=3003601 RepID=A0ABY7JT31_9FIRM|nr:purine-nucleoside phosphorylase [Peptostreptococcus sp. CBA3647]WAW15629.1 purine-nucleoside phosphorylase [Peptostreptococcus sp. CBA3647]
MKEKINETLSYIQEIYSGRVEIGMILGSGLGFIGDKIENPIIINYSDIPHFKISSVQSHRNRLIIGDLFGKKVLAMQGRIHYYEGFTQEEITYPIKIFKKLGIEKILLTNAAGGCNHSFSAGDIMIINDHINFSGKNPLIGPNDDDLGPRFPDMSNIYKKKYRELVKKCAVENNIEVKEGVYMYFSGPSYETPAEIRMASLMGADAVGMSTVPEAIVANYCDMDVIAISCISNLAAGISDMVLNHKEVIETTNRVKNNLSKLVEEIVLKI